MTPARTLILPLVLAAGTAAAQDGDLAAAGAQLFHDHCAACHGLDARGAGPMRPILNVPAPDLTRLAMDRGGFPHLDVARKIDGRDPLVSHGSDMPVWGPYFDGPEAAFVFTKPGQPIATSGPVAALIAYLESIQQP